MSNGGGIVDEGQYLALLAWLPAKFVATPSSRSQC